ncbi:hypothetical protein F5X99DRAFT_236173 [Biscogniauxia marginata]|nr:hypothetical protein F5X99DRAFT_236173 [Biscogniauxia marginata]
MVALRKRTGRKGGLSLEAECLFTPVMPSSSGSHVDLTGETSNNRGSMRDRLKEIRGNIKKRMSINSIILQMEDTSVEEEERQQSWPALRKSISSIASSLRNHHSSTESRPSQDITRQYFFHCSRTSSCQSQDADHRSHTIHGCRTPPALSRAGSNIRRLSLGAWTEPSSEYDSTPRLPTLGKMLAEAEEGIFSKDSWMDAGDGIGIFNDLDIPVFDVDWHGNLPIRPKQAELPATETPDAPTSTQDKKRGSASDSGISVCSSPALGSSPVGHKATGEQETHQATRQSDASAMTGKSHQLSIKWSSNVSDVTRMKNEQTIPEAQVDITSKVPVHWLDCILETSVPLRVPTKARLHTNDPEVLEQLAIIRAKRMGKIAVITPSRNERLLPKQYYGDIKVATQDLFRRFRYQYSPFMAFVPSRRAIYLYRPEAQRSEVNSDLPSPDSHVFDIEDVMDGNWGDLGSIPGFKEDEDDKVSISSEATEVPVPLEQHSAASLPPTYREGLEWIDPDGEAYMRSEISLLQDDDDLALASRLS